MPTQKFRVTGLRHEDEQRIADRIKEIPGVFYASLNHQDACAEVDFEDDRVTAKEIRNAIRALGFDAHLAS